MKYDVEMGSGAMMYISSFIRIGTGIPKLIWGLTDTQTAWRWLINGKYSRVEKERKTRI
jgi:hypothetical protein